jgi:hypothetical protein
MIQRGNLTCRDLGDGLSFLGMGLWVWRRSCNVDAGSLSGFGIWLQRPFFECYSAEYYGLRGVQLTVLSSGNETSDFCGGGVFLFGRIH